MTTFSDHRLILLLSIVLIMAPTAGLATDEEDFEFTVVLDPVYELNPWLRWDLEIRARCYWIPPLYETTGYNFNADGRRHGVFSSPSDSAPVFWHSSPALHGCENAAAWYLAKPHTYTLEVRSKSGAIPVVYCHFDYVPPDILRIENRVAGFSEAQACEIVHGQTGTEGFDGDDVEVSPVCVSAEARIVSVVSDPNGGNEYELNVDARAKDSTTEVCLKLDFIRSSDDPIVFSLRSENSLHFSLPYAKWGPDSDFGSKPITIQQYDPSAPDLLWPIHDVRKIIAKNDGVMPLADLLGSYPAGEPYAYFKLRFEEETSAYSPTDLNRDGRFDLRDFSVLGRDWKARGVVSLADIAGRKGLGIPDGNVDAYDLEVFCRRWAGVAREGFETGRIESHWRVEGDQFWRATSTQSRSGRYSAKSGAIEHDQSTSLSITLDCKDGQISFWRKVSSESGYDFLKFYIDATEQSRWSGQHDWERLAYPVDAGQRKFTWTYVKDGSSSDGDDRAWLDDIMFPALSLE